MGHFGTEKHHEDAHEVLNELKTQLDSLQEGSKDSFVNTIQEFKKSKPEHKELLDDFILYSHHSLK